MDSLSATKIAATAAALGLILSLTAVPLVRAWAHRVGLVDRPDPTRKLHRGDIALGGGLAVLLATLGASGAVLALASQRLGSVLFEGPLSALSQPFSLNQQWLGLLLGGLGIVALGVVDDRFALRGRQKLLGQIAVAVLVAVLWHPASEVELFGWQIDLGSAALPLAIVWLLTAINAVNLIDGADGVASTVGAVVCGSITLIAITNGQLLTAVVAAAMAASLIGFLCFNRPPATIFLGDAGSMLIGLVGGTLACWSVESAESVGAAASVGSGGRPLPMLVPVAVLAVPLFDAATAFLRRILTGRSIFAADRGHLHHILADYLRAHRRSPVWMLGVFATLCLVTSAGAIAGAALRSDWLALLGIATVVGGLVCTRVFGHAEARLLVTHGKRVGGSLIARHRSCHDQIHVAGIALQGNRKWENVWAPLVEFAQANNLWRLQLDLNIAWRHEGYHGFWSRGRLPEKSEQWSMRLPIICDRRPVGRLEVIGQAGSESEYQSLETFTHLISGMQPAIDALVHALEEQQMPAAPAPPLAGLPEPTHSSEEQHGEEQFEEFEVLNGSR
ncbi:MraY family glycosyltransferase [Candidatus Laterigemmans baculatus]|uniref:MraY family glycosyltransferase n=1 Tax=Candidatus Laterigemmans baculatus TaxID=2770505 RepID=UPI0013DD56C9|nr:MraY family glycosyltransferase [Candidatus Laterigemmans baculatus]